VSIPSVAGPLKVTEDSYAFSSAAATIVPQDLSKFGYVEEEFFVSGKANVLDFESAEHGKFHMAPRSYTWSGMRDELCV
jgi:hypothetical protein